MLPGMSRASLAPLSILFLAALVAGCPSSPSGGGDDGGASDGGGGLDGSPADAGRDAAGTTDGAGPDAIVLDAATSDAAQTSDDAGELVDGDLVDAAPTPDASGLDDAGADAGCPDCSALDDACHVGVCTGTTCMAQARPEGTLCDDGDACTTADACLGGTCVGAPVYAWVAGPFGACSASCGPGQQSRGVACTRCGAESVDPSLCTEAAPSATQSCDAGACPSYTWVTSPFSACSVSCGGGTQSRSVACVDDAGTMVFEGLCPSPRPAAVPACNPSACDTYAWVAGPYSTCSVTCGSGTQARSVTCTSSSGAAVSDALCTGARPDATRVCNTTPCSGFGWAPGAWSACSTTCGTGTRTRVVVCLDATGAAVPSSSCSGLPMPATMEACSVSCYRWAPSAWSTCSVPCGVGSQVRTVACTSDTGPVSAALCAGIPMPPTMQACSPGACPSVAWRPGSWSACSAACGGGTRTRVVDCVDGTGAVVASSRCADMIAPSASETCNTQPCR